MAFSVLPNSTLESDVAYHRPDVVHPPQCDLDSPAIDAMTDLKRVSASTVRPDESIDEALDIMKQRGVRLLLVTDRMDRVEGVISAQDINGEKPLKFIQTNGVSRKEVTVRDIMTPHEQEEVLMIQDVSRARIGDVVETLKKTGRQHALVCDNQGPGNAKTVRGIFSLNQIARQLGINIQSYEISHTFAEIAHIMNK